MLLRLLSIAGLTAIFLFTGPTFAVTSKQKMETCKFGADDQKLEGAPRKAFMAKCLSNANSPRGKPEPKTQ
jgi:hypothetical protein